MLRARPRAVAALIAQVVLELLDCWASPSGGPLSLWQTSPTARGAVLVKSEAGRSELLDGVEVNYTYSGGWQIILSFYAGQLRYRWLSGPFEGVIESDLRYQAAAIGTEKSLVNWHDTKNSNFVTLLFDFDEKVVHSSALLYYGTEQELTSFDTAVINNVSRAE
jgi:hypothetical protein